MELKKIMRIGGKIGAGLLGLGGLILAGRSGFGENLKFGSPANEPAEDMADPPIGDTETLVPEETPEPDPTEEETSE